MEIEIKVKIELLQEKNSEKIPIISQIPIIPV
jgi:hypothetical protein